MTAGKLRGCKYQSLIGVSNHSPIDHWSAHCSAKTVLVNLINLTLLSKLALMMFS